MSKCHFNKIALQRKTNLLKSHFGMVFMKTNVCHATVLLLSFISSLLQT